MLKRIPLVGRHFSLQERFTYGMMLAPSCQAGSAMLSLHPFRSFAVHTSNQLTVVGHTVCLLQLKLHGSVSSCLALLLACGTA